MVKYLKNKFIKNIIDFYNFQISSLSLEMSYNEKYSEEEINNMINQTDKYKEMIKMLNIILVDLNENKF